MNSSIADSCFGLVRKNLGAIKSLKLSSEEAARTVTMTAMSL